MEVTFFLNQQFITQGTVAVRTYWMVYNSNQQPWQQKRARCKQYGKESYPYAITSPK